MGTKRGLANKVGEAVNACASGKFLDVFSGTCSVGESLGTERQVLSNDIQVFAWNVAKAFFCSNEDPMKLLPCSVPVNFEKNLEALTKTHYRNVVSETKAINAKSIKKLREIQNEFAFIDVQNIKASRFPYDLFTISYAGTYFSLYQCMEIDSIRFAIDKALKHGDISEEEWRWLVLALCKALSRCSTSTGHFAQFLTLKMHNKRRFFSQREKSIWLDWLAARKNLAPIGNRSWRARNRAFNLDALSLLRRLKKQKGAPKVIYADPPYTKDQYSRFYHLYETLILYDYPQITGKGRYRANRVVSDFSLASKVERAIEELIFEVSDLGADLVLSYPTNGLMSDSRQKIPRLLHRHFKRTARPIEMPHIHSTMGGSKGAASYEVTEVIYRAFST